MNPVRVLALILGGLAALHAQGQQPTFRTRIDLIQVNVVAVDAAGKHVYGLTASDFTLLDRGRPQTISNFQEIDSGRLPAEQARVRLPASVRRDVATNHTAEMDRLVILVVDDLHIFKGRTDRAKAVARDSVNKLAPGAFMAVLFTSGQRSTEVTDDAPRLLAAVETLNGRQSWRRPHPAEDNQTATPLSPEADSLVNLDIVNRSQSVKVQDFFDNMAQFKTLEDAARMLRLSPARRKAFVVVTEGIGLNPTGVFDEPLPDIVSYHGRALQDMMRSMRRSNVATYVLDPRGHVTTRELEQELHPSPAGLLGTAGGTAKDDDSSFRWYNPVRMAQDGLRTIAEASGGFAVTDDDDLSSGLSRIIEDLDHYYLLGFYPADPDGPQYRPLEVKTSRPGLTLRFRRAYAEIGPPDPPKKNTDPLAQLIVSALPSSDVPLRLHAIQMPSLTRETRVALALELTVPQRARDTSDAQLLDDIRYGVFVVDLKQGKVTRQFTNTARVTFKAEGKAEKPPDTFRYQILTALSLPPGTYQIRASARSETLGAGGSVFLPLTVTDSSRRALDLADPVLGYVEGPRLSVARDKTLSTEDSLKLPLEPALDRVFTANDTLRLFVSIARRQPSTPKATVIVRATDGTTAFSENVALSEGDDAVDALVPLAGFAPGTYVLRVTVSDGSNKAEREVGFVVR